MPTTTQIGWNAFTSTPRSRSNLTKWMFGLRNASTALRSRTPMVIVSMASAAVSDALELVEQFFWKQAVENRLRRNQETTSAPSRYKKQVEEYFRRIAEGE